MVDMDCCDIYTPRVSERAEVIDVESVWSIWGLLTCQEVTIQGNEVLEFLLCRRASYLFVGWVALYLLAVTLSCFCLSACLGHGPSRQGSTQLFLVAMDSLARKYNISLSTGQVMHWRESASLVVASCPTHTQSSATDEGSTNTIEKFLTSIVKNPLGFFDITWKTLANRTWPLRLVPSLVVAV